MLPHPMSRSEPSANDSHPLPASDLRRILEQHVQAGFPTDLALDLVLNELVVRAADATHASAAALALVRGDEMVCRAATGLHAPDLGIPLNTRDGLSGACVRTRSPQLSTDTESDPRVDAAISRRLGIRSMLTVPVFDPALDEVSNEALDELHNAGLHNDLPDGFHGSDLPSKNSQSKDGVSEIGQPLLVGVLEVFSPLPNAFSQSAQTLLEDFACECARIRHAATRLRARPPAEIIPLDGELLPPDAEPIPAGLELIPSASIANDSPSAIARFRQPYEGWALVLGALVILAAAAFSFMIGSRIGWLRSPQPASSSEPSPLVSVDSSSPAASAKSAPGTHNPASPRTKPAPQPSAKSTKDASTGSSDELVVYEKGKVVFRMAPAPPVDGRTPLPAQRSEAALAHDAAPDHATTQAAAPIVAPSSTTRSASPHTIWLAPAQAESRLLRRVEPEYPADALAAHRSGNVTLEVHVAEDGTVSSVRTLSGDPFLAAAAADAVRSWRYEPYRPHDHPSPFQTDVTLTFSLPN